jgi:hypothetical protein
MQRKKLRNSSPGSKIPEGVHPKPSDEVLKLKA